MNLKEATFLFFSWVAASPPLLSESPPLLPELSPDLASASPVSVVPPDIPPTLLSALSSDLQASLIRLPGDSKAPVAYRLINPARHRDHFAVQAFWRTSHGITGGSRLLARFYVRTVSARQEAGEGIFGFYFQQIQAPWHKTIQTRVSVGSAWQLIEIPFIAADDYSPGEVAAYLSFAYIPQTVEFTAPEILDFADRVPFAALPFTRFSYAGREPDAAWRSEALLRIEELRVSPLRICVRDSEGLPISGARVQAWLELSEFHFGSEIDTAWIVKNTPEARRYRELSLELFDLFTPGSGLKWQRWYFPTAASGRLWTRDETLKALEWLYTQKVPIKGHVLVWGGWDFTPQPVREMLDKADRARRLSCLVNNFIHDVTTATKDRIAIWDVLNEPLNEPDYLDLLGEEVAAGWFKQARELAPSAQLFINEYGMLTGDRSSEMVEKFLALISRLRGHGAPIDGIGIQGHFGEQIPAIKAIKTDMDRLASAGLPIHITEFDINTPDEQLQADFTRDFLILCYSHPGFSGFINWGFWQGTHWLPLAAMYRHDWSIKPNGQVWRELVLGEWRTSIDATTSAAGDISAKGHRGRYRVEVTLPDGRTAGRTFQLTRASGQLTVILP